MDIQPMELEQDTVRPTQVVDRSTKYVCLIETPNGPRIIARPARDHEMRLVEVVRKNLVAGIDVSIRHTTVQSLRGTHIPEALERYEYLVRDLKMRQRKIIPDAEVEEYKQELASLEGRVREFEVSIFVQFVVSVKIGGIYRKMEGSPEPYHKQCQRMNALRKKMPEGTRWEISVVPEHLVGEVPFVSEPVLKEDGKVEQYLDQHLGSDTSWYSPDDSEGRKQFRHLLEDNRQNYDLTLEQVQRLNTALSCLLQDVISQPEDSDMRSIQGRLSKLIVRLQSITWEKSGSGKSQPRW